MLWNGNENLQATIHITDCDRSVTVEYFNSLGSVTTNHARCTRYIKSSIAMAKAASNRKKTLFSSRLDLNLREKLVKCYTWSRALYGAETGTFRKADQK